MTETLPILLIVSSPSGAGKTTLCTRLLAEFPSITFSISHTTRPPRPTEVSGRDYYFVDDTTFDAMVEAGRFIEWARVHGNRYGTARTEIERAKAAGVDLIFDVDFQGARQIKQQYPDAVGVFVLPPSIEELQQRLKRRGTESPESLERRFEAALGEIAHHKLFDYLVVNDVIDVAYDQLRAVLIAEHQKHRVMAAVADKLLEG
jgi:guanylate kinase